MAQLKITADQAATLRGLRSLADTDSSRKQAKKDLFNAFRSTFGIPPHVKLKVEIDNTTAADYLVLKDKTTGRELVGDSQTYGGALRFTNVASAPVATPAAAQMPGTPGNANTARFSVAASDTPTVRSITVAALLDLVKDDTDYNSDADTLPAGAPQLTGDQVLLDNQTGKLYFLAD